MNVIEEVHLKNNQLIVQLYNYQGVVRLVEKAY